MLTIGVCSEFLRRGSGVRAKLLNIFMELRKVCNHPFLLTGAEAQLTEGKNKAATSELLVSASSKMIVRIGPLLDLILL